MTATTDIQDFTAPDLQGQMGHNQIDSLKKSCLAKLPFHLEWEECIFKKLIVNVTKVKVLEDDANSEQHIFIKSKHSREKLEFVYNGTLQSFEYYGGNINYTTFLNDYAYSVENI